MKPGQRRRRGKTPRIRRLTSPGAAPGTVEVPHDAPRPAIRLIRYDSNGILETDIEDVGRLGELLDDRSVAWVNVDGLGDVTVLQRLRELFGIHDLAMEDVVNLHQRPKVEEYSDHLFVVLRMVSRREALESEQLGMFVGANFVLTLQERPSDCLDPVRERLRKGRGRIRSLGSDFLAYALIDAVVDAYFPVVDEYGEWMEQLDQELSSGHPPRFMESIHDVRADLLTLRRAIRPLRDALTLLMPDPHALISQETQFHLRDCYDHVVQVLDLLDTYREMCSDLRDFYMSAVNNRMNEIMKVLTIIATVFIPLSFITGIYGMNFNTGLPGNMPELDWPYGYVLALLVMGGVGLGLLGFIWRKGWLGGNSRG
jgi:magnesium transporter